MISLNCLNKHFWHIKNLLNETVGKNDPGESYFGLC